MFAVNGEVSQGKTRESPLCAPSARWRALFVLTGVHTNDQIGAWGAIGQWRISSDSEAREPSQATILRTPLSRRVLFWRRLVRAFEVTGAPRCSSSYCWCTSVARGRHAMTYHSRSASTGRVRANLEQPVGLCTRNHVGIATARGVHDDVDRADIAEPEPRHR